MEFDLQEMIEDCQSSQESIGENEKDELTTYSDIAFDDIVEKQLDI